MCREVLDLGPAADEGARWQRWRKEHVGGAMGSYIVEPWTVSCFHRIFIAEKKGEKA